MLVAVIRLIACCWLLAWVAPAGLAFAHDASAYGGVFRSRNFGATWLNADVGLFLNAPLSVAVDPRDPAHLLLGTELGLLVSGNGGRSWTEAAPKLITGAVFAVSFAPGGDRAVAASPSGLFVQRGGAAWQAASAPAAAAPARAIAFGAGEGPEAHVYVLGRTGLFRSDDGGATYRALKPVPDLAAPVTTLAVARAPREILLIVAGGRVASSEDGGRNWNVLSTTIPADFAAWDQEVPGRAWAGGASRIWRGDDAGREWRPVGQPFPQPGTLVRGIAADRQGAMLVVTTQRGLFRSTDGGQNWALLEGGLPIHLEAGPLARDPADPRVLYAAYSLVPYAEVWRAALESSALLARRAAIPFAGIVAFLVLTILCGTVLVRFLVRLRAGRPATIRPLQ